MKGDIRIKNKDNSIDQLDRDLYDPRKDFENRSRRRIHERDIELEQEFKGDDFDKIKNERQKYKLPSSLFKKIFIASLLFFSVAAVLAGFSLYEGNTTVSEDLIAMDMIAQPFVDGGEQLKLQVQVQNFNEQELQLPDLVLSYPKDSGIDAEKIFLRRSLPPVGPRDLVTESFDIVLFGQEGDVREIEATLEYRIDKSSSIFIKEAAHEVIVRSAPTQIAIDAPASVVRDQEIVLAVELAKNSSVQVNDTLLKITYPPAFEFLSSNIEPQSGNNTWAFPSIGDVTERIELTGRLSALEGQGQSFLIEYGKQSQLNQNVFETVFNARTHTVNVLKPFIETGLIVEGDTDGTTSMRSGDEVYGTLSYKNTLATNLQSPKISLILEGDIYDSTKVFASKGFFDSSQKTIIFDRTTIDGFDSLSPGEEGEFEFRIGLRDILESQETINQPKLDLVVDVVGQEPNGDQQTAFGISRHTISLNSDFRATSRALYGEGAFVNTGPMPPKVDTPTTYTAVFSVTNNSNLVRGAKLTATLPSYIRYLNQVAPSIERRNVTFEPTTRILTWNIGDVEAGHGYGNKPPKELFVQLELTPSATQLGNSVEMTGEITLTGTDSFTDTSLNFKQSPLENILEDRDIEGSGGRIVQ